MKFKNPAVARKLKYGTFATVFTIIFIAAVVIINIIATALVERFPLEIDLTKEGLFEVTDTTKDYLDTLEKDITITILAAEDTFAGVNDYYSQANEVIKTYGKLSGRIQVEYVDVVKNPTFVSQYPDLSLQSGNILVTCGEKAKVLTAYDLFNTETSSYGSGASITSSRAEEAVTSAIMSVASEVTYHVAMVTGHDETELPVFTSLLEQNTYEVSSLHLAVSDIPEETNVIVICAPLRDFDEEEIRKLETFLDNDTMYGKNLIYIADPTQPSLPNLELFLSDWGIQIGSGVVYETNVNNVISMNPYYAIAEYVSSEATEKYSEKFADRSYPVAMPSARPLSLTFETKDARSTMSLLQFSSSAGVAPVDADEDFDFQANVSNEPIPALVLSSQVRFDELDALRSNVAVFSASSFFSTNLLESTSFSNGEYLMNLLSQMVEKEEGVEIVPKNIETTYIPFTQAQVYGIAGTFTIALPLLVLIFGIVVWIRRRHL